MQTTIAGTMGLLGGMKVFHSEYIEVSKEKVLILYDRYLLCISSWVHSVINELISKHHVKILGVPVMLAVTTLTNWDA